MSPMFDETADVLVIRHSVTQWRHYDEIYLPMWICKILVKWNIHAWQIDMIV